MSKVEIFNLKNLKIQTNIKIFNSVFFLIEAKLH